MFRSAGGLVLLSSLGLVSGFPTYAFNAQGKCDPDVMLQSGYTNSDGVAMTRYVGMHGPIAMGGATIQVLFNSAPVTSYTPGETYTVIAYSPGEYGAMITASSGNFTTAAAIAGGTDQQCYLSTTKMVSHSQTWIAPSGGAVTFISRHGKAGSNVRGELTISPPSAAPSAAPTDAPTDAPSEAPTAAPTHAPTEAPTNSPTAPPTDSPTEAPTDKPATDAPTDTPTESPTASLSITAPPSESPTVAPTNAPTDAPVCTRAAFEASMVGCEAQGSVCQTEVNAGIGDLAALKTAFACGENESSACLDFISCTAGAASASNCDPTLLPASLRRLKFTRDEICAKTSTASAADVCKTSPCA